MEKIVVNSEEIKNEVLSYLKEENSNILVRIDKDYLNKFDYENQIKNQKTEKYG